MFRTGATMPWLEVDYTDNNNVRLTYYNGPKEDAKKDVMVLTPHEARELKEALDAMLFYWVGEEDEEGKEDEV